MRLTGSRIRTRVTSVLVVAAIHFLLIATFWELRIHLPRESESFTSEMFFISEGPRASGGSVFAAPIASPPRRNPGTRRVAKTEDSSSAITLPSVLRAPPPAEQAKTDWYGQLEGVATSALENEKRRERQLGALTRKYQLDDEPAIPPVSDLKGFRWYDAGEHLIDTRGSIPVLHLGDRCVLAAFILPICVIGHIEAHGDLFDKAVRPPVDLLTSAVSDKAPKRTGE